MRLEISPTATTPTGFIARGLEAFSSCAGILGFVVCLAPQLFLLVYPHQMWEIPSAGSSLTCPSLPAAALMWVLSTFASRN